jgi:hypothetical protein
MFDLFFLEGEAGDDSGLTGAEVALALAPTKRS